MDTTNEEWGLSLATSGDLYLATTGDLLMATDKESLSIMHIVRCPRSDG
jgi:hypothetical protein